MKRLKLLSLLLLLQTCAFAGYAQQTVVAQMAPGVQKITFGTPDKFTPYSFCTQKPLIGAMQAMSASNLPFNIGDISITETGRGVIVEIPLTDDEHLYGFGLQIGSFDQRGLRKKPIVNDNPSNDLGYTHAPETFYVSTKGYGILINTARYTTFFCGSIVNLIVIRPWAGEVRCR